jgi:hypothetical protein
MYKCEHVATCSFRFDLSTKTSTADTVKTVQFKVNGTDPYMAMIYLHIGLLQL